MHRPSPTGPNRSRAATTLAGGALALLLVPLLSSCGLLAALALVATLPGDCTQRVPFEEVALDGTYRGTASLPGTDTTTDTTTGAPVALSLTPSWVDPDRYTVAGSFTDPAGRTLALEGTVSSGCYEYEPSASLQGQTQPPPGQGLSATASGSEGAVWTIAASRISRSGFDGRLERVADGESYALEVTRSAP